MAAQLSITSHDVARLAGVSQSTVSRALRGDPRVSAETLARVREAAQSLEYTPSGLGRSLSTRSTRNIGVLAGDLANPFYPYIVAPLQERLDSLGYRMVLFTEWHGDSDALERLLDRSLDGVVLSSATVDSRLPALLDRRGLPFVFLNRVTDGVDADAAIVDNVAGGVLVGAEFARLGHERVGALFGPPTTSTGRDRERGFRTALAAAGIDLAESRVEHGPFAFETGYLGIRRLLAAAEPPTAVFCGNDVIAIGAINGAAKAGIRMPRDLSLIGFDDIPPAGWEVLSLTTVRQPMTAMARSAAELLVHRIETKEPVPRRVEVFEPALVLRGTHGPVEVG